jgi:hypothetical protein
VELVMWNVAITYNDPNNFMTDKALFSAAVNSAVTYLNRFIAGSTTLNVKVEVSSTTSGRFAGNGAITLDSTENGLNFMTAQAVKELALGSNLNGSSADLTIYVDPTTDYFKGLYFDGGAYDSPRVVPSNKTDGLSVVLHELMHGLGINSYRDFTTNAFSGTYRTIWDKYVTVVDGKQYLNMPGFAAHGIDPVQVTSTSVSQNNSHLGDATDLNKGYLDDVMNGLYFYLGHHYQMSQLDVLILQGLGYNATMPDGLQLSDASLTGKGLVTPLVTSSTAAVAMTGNVMHLSGTAQAGSTTSILEHNTLLAQTKADANGNWSLDIVIDPSLTASSLVVRDGTHLMDSRALTVTRSTDAGLHLTNSAQFKLMDGGAHDDVFTVAVRNATISGNAGLDTAVYAEARAGNSISRGGEGGFLVSGANGSDYVTGVERLQFSDGMVALDTGVQGVAGQAYRIYQAAFNRTPDSAGLGYWIKQMDGGASVLNVATAFVASGEFKTLYGEHPGNADILTRYYQNVLHRTPDQAGYDYWLDAMDHKGATAAGVLADFSQSAENVAALVGVMQNGVAYTPYG